MLGTGRAVQARFPEKDIWCYSGYLFEKAFRTARWETTARSYYKRNWMYWWTDAFVPGKKDLSLSVSRGWHPTSGWLCARFTEAGAAVQMWTVWNQIERAGPRRYRQGLSTPEGGRQGRAIQRDNPVRRGQDILPRDLDSRIGRPSALILSMILVPTSPPQQRAHPAVRGRARRDRRRPEP